MIQAVGGDPSARAAIKQQRACGLTYLLNGDDVRRGPSRDLVFTDADGAESVRRVAENSQAHGRRRADCPDLAISPFVHNGAWREPIDFVLRRLARAADY